MKKLTRKQLLERWYTDEGIERRNLIMRCLEKNIPLENLDFIEKIDSYYDLRGITFDLKMNLKNITLKNIDFSYCDLSELILTNCNIQNVIFYMSNCCQFTQFKCIFENCKFVKCKLNVVLPKDGKHFLLKNVTNAIKYLQNELRMFRYFYRIWDRFRYKNKDKSEVIGAAIYTYKGARGKDKKYVYRVPKLEDEVLIYNFRTIDVETLDLEKISFDNPLRIVFNMAKTLLNTSPKDIEIYNAKIKLAEELLEYDKVKNEEQIKALADFLEYLFLIKDEELESKYEEYKRERGGAIKMTVDQIREKYYTLKGKEEGKIEGIKEGIEKEKIENAINFLKLGISAEIVAQGTGLSLEEVNKIKDELNK